MFCTWANGILRGTFDLLTSASGSPQAVQVLSRQPPTNTYELLITTHKMPSLGYRLLRVVPHAGANRSELQASATTPKNSQLPVVVDPATGCIASLFSKKPHFGYLTQGACDNEIIASQDTPKDYVAWNPDIDHHFTRLHKADSVEVSEKGRATVRLVCTWRSRGLSTTSLL
jgi:alpha-mannosidase